MLSDNGSYRKLTRIFCGKAGGKNHEVGAVYATPEGMVVRVHEVVWSADEQGRWQRAGGNVLEIRAVPEDELKTMALDDIPNDLIDTKSLWCGKCGTALPGFQARAAFQLARSGKRAYRLADDFTVRRYWDPTPPEVS